MVSAQGCNPTIVSTFAKVAHQTNFAYCFSIIEANQQLSHLQARTASSQSVTNATPTRGSPITPSRQSSASSFNPSLTIPRQARRSNVDAGLDSYFPFDPYDLPRSKRWIESLYRTWEEVAVDAAADSESESDESSDEEAEDMSASPDSIDQGRLPARVSLPRAKSGRAYDHKMRRLSERDRGLSSSLEGMLLSPGLSGMVG